MHLTTPFIVHGSQYDQYILQKCNLSLLQGQFNDLSRSRTKDWLHYFNRTFSVEVVLPSFIAQLNNGEIKRSIVNFVGLEKTVTEMVTGHLRTMKSCHFYIK